MSQTQAQEILEGTPRETMLRKRTFGVVNHYKYSFLSGRAIETTEINGYMDRTELPSTHKSSYHNLREYLIMTPTTITAASKTNTVQTHSNLSRLTLMTRRFSESSADDLHRSDDLFKEAIVNEKMWRKGTVANSNIPIPSRLKRSKGYCPRYHNEDDDDDYDDGSDVDGCCCYSIGSRRNRISDVIDVALRVMLVFIFIRLEVTKPFKRKLHPEEMWLYKNPRTPDIVSAQTLLLSVIFCPLFVTMFHLWLTGDRRDFRAASWVWTLGLGLNGLITGLLKITVGRHRPDFFYRCFPDGIEVLNNITTIIGGDIYNCTGDIHQISEGRKSFPSGHASFSFLSFGFIAIYLASKLHAFSPRGRGQTWRLCVSFMPLLLSALIAVSRTCDYHHHWEDVLTGSIIGMSISYLVYRQYYPALTSKYCHRPYLRACHRRRRENTNQLNQRSVVYERLSSKEDILDDDDDNGELASYGDHVGDSIENERRRII